MLRRNRKRHLRDDVSWGPTPVVGTTVVPGPGGLPFQTHLGDAGMTCADFKSLSMLNELSSQMRPSITGTQRHFAVLTRRGVMIFKKVRPIDELYQIISSIGEGDSYVQGAHNFALRYGPLETCTMCIAIACDMPCDLGGGQQGNPNFQNIAQKAVIAMQHVHESYMARGSVDPQLQNSYQVTAFSLFAARALRPLWFRFFVSDAVGYERRSSRMVSGHVSPSIAPLSHYYAKT